MLCLEAAHGNPSINDTNNDETSDENEYYSSTTTDNSGRPRVVYLGKTNLTSAFRVLPMKIGCFHWLLLKAVDPADGKTKYFVDKCLPFGSSISCLHYQ